MLRLFSFTQVSKHEHTLLKLNNAHIIMFFISFLNFTRKQAVRPSDTFSTIYSYCSPNRNLSKFSSDGYAKHKNRRYLFGMCWYCQGQSVFWHRQLNGVPNTTIS